MRVLILSNWFPPVVSGSSFYSNSLAHSLAARGHKVIVVTLDWGPEFTPHGDLTFPVYRLPVTKIPKLPLFYNLELMGFAFTPANSRRLKLLIEQHRPQIIHHVNHIFDTNFLSTSVARSMDVPVVGTITTPIQHQSPWRQRIMALADRLTVGAFGVKRWDGIVSLDHVMHDEYVGKLYGLEAKARSVVIPYGVRIDSTASYDERPPRSERPQVLMVGHIHPFRNPIQLVRAMPYVLKEVPDARLILAGRIDLQEPVQVARELSLSSDQVQFLGETPHKEVVRLLQTSHVFASWVTGPYAGLGTAPMEAMLCETPVINDLPENLFGEGTLKNDHNIVLVNSRDPRSIADATIRLIKDPKLRQRIGAGGRRFVLDHLSWDSITTKMEHFYENIITENGISVKSLEAHQV
jgi:glycosyltransferase involved in cell wall biosynthesis